MGFALVDYRVARLASAPSGGATGTVTVTLPQVPIGQVWRVEQICVECLSSTTTSLLCYDLPPGPGVVPCQGTRYGNFTVDDQGSPLALLGGTQLTLVWAGVSEGAIGRARIQYEVLTGTAGGPTPVAS